MRGQFLEVVSFEFGYLTLSKVWVAESPGQVCIDKEKEQEHISSGQWDWTVCNYWSGYR